MSDVAEEKSIVGDKLTDQSKTISLFQFILELNRLKQKAILNTKDYPWAFALSNLPDDPGNIKMCYHDRVEEEPETADAGHDNTLLSVHKPEFQRCPEPSATFKEWLLPGWDSFYNDAGVKDFIEPNPRKEIGILSLFDNEPEDVEGNLQREMFTDKEGRVKSYQKWLDVRSKWVVNQQITERTRKLFADLYRFYFELQRESETEEIIVANGVLCDARHPEIRHPILTHRVKMDYDANSDTVSIVDTDTPSELYSAVFQVMEDINLSGINTLSEDLQTNDFHPLDRNETPEFLKVLVHQLSSSSLFSEQPIPSGEKTHSRLLLYLNPCFIVRKRLDGTLKAIEKIIENVQDTGDVPKPIRDIVSGGIIDIPEDIGEAPIEERLAAVGGESIDTLLSKEANKEQLDIAKRIEQYNAVLVQGPPGTGKTHTIANLMGHFLAQGKSVLVTSYTKKALSVLKEKVSPGLQDLCVSMLDDSNVDMERSVDGITSYTSRTTSFEVKREMDSLAADRRDIISKLAEVRKKIFAIINQECSCIVLSGEDISPSKAAAFVVEHAEDLSYIPGTVRLNVPIPLSFEQMSVLYRSNECVTADDERELQTDLPNPSDILIPSDFMSNWNQMQAAIEQINDARTKNAWTIEYNSTERTIRFSGSCGRFTMPYPSVDAIDDLRQYALSFGKIDKWMKAVAVDGKRGKAYRQRWQTLIAEIKRTCSCADDFLTESLGKQLSINESLPFTTAKSVFEELRPIFSEKGKTSKFTFLLHKNYKTAIAAVTINGSHPTSADDCNLILKYIDLQQARQLCSAAWDDLFITNDVPAFATLDRNDPERIAKNWVPLIQKYLDWYDTDYTLLIRKLASIGILGDTLFQKDILDTELAATDKILTCVEQVVPPLCDVCISILKEEACQKSFHSQKTVLTSGKRGNSAICKSLVHAMNCSDFSAYSEAYAALERIFEKYELLKNRTEMLKVLEPIAPQWAEAIRTRQGVHGSCTVPGDIDQAWKWKQLCGIIEEITQKPFAELQADSLRLSSEYREVTAKYAEKSGWYHLLRRTEADINMKQALEGWRLTVKSIGKGTGKRAPMLKAKARELMAKCQNAVPGWIMPINKALESLDPRVNRFDIIIIDEASQSDVSSLAILYMGKKLIIVGDDKQVSPMAVGIEDKKISSLQEQYIKDKIPNAHLYTAKTSIYDVAKTTFQPLMLREHFRCVPEIIGFSNMLSYDGKIKPLRDASNSVLLPAVVNYRVTNGQRIDATKTNPKEAETIVALMMACFEQPEYEGKSFGIISLLGDEQVKDIQQEIERKLKPQDIIGRRILCGNSANFQGDERDVIFLSLVDSGTGDGPIRMQNFGPDDTYRKRYNVAVSRARDQLWVVDSLDPANDLKPGDIRKTLIDYSLDPKALEIAHTEIAKNADSPFEIAISTALSDRGYHLVQQWKVGSYRLDIVVVCGKKKVAIECDGERWHSGEEKIREDMERQTILERLGWRFIRIRGSEFYRDNEKSIERMISELAQYGIEPENAAESKDPDRETELLKRVKARAAAILNADGTIPPEQDQATIAAALDPRTIVPDGVTPKPLPAPDDIAKVTRGRSPVSIPKVTSCRGEPATTKSTVPMRPEKITTHPAARSKNPSSEAAYAKSRQQTLPETSGLGAAALKAAKGDDLIKELQGHGLEVIDNRTQSSIAWVIVDAEEKSFVESVIRKHNCRSSLEKRGSIATRNRPAWRIMF
ncbi:MAG: AAA domain-containing protein [Eubacteriales bacterium]|nr:AAA domain-containing protein [Eubacteriales bacterium]